MSATGGPSTVTNSPGRAGNHPRGGANTLDAHYRECHFVLQHKTRVLLKSKKKNEVPLGHPTSTYKRATCTHSTFPVLPHPSPCLLGLREAHLPLSPTRSAAGLSEPANCGHSSAQRCADASPEPSQKPTGVTVSSSPGQLNTERRHKEVSDSNFNVDSEKEKTRVQAGKMDKVEGFGRPGF